MKALTTETGFRPAFESKITYDLKQFQGNWALGNQEHLITTSSSIQES